MKTFAWKQFNDIRSTSGDREAILYAQAHNKTVVLARSSSEETIYGVITNSTLFEDNRFAVGKCGDYWSTVHVDSGYSVCLAAVSRKQAIEYHNARIEHAEAREVGIFERRIAQLDHTWRERTLSQILNAENAAHGAAA